ncbi:MAG: hypothetical protein PHQ27_07295 [Victivallales bacterium]|nr:hypothetical protein [Victivallales bacterium]
MTTTDKITAADYRLLGLVLLITGLMFAPALGFPFLPEWDDRCTIFNGHMAWSWVNARYWLTHNVQGLFTPAQMYSLMLDYGLVGPRPFWFHLHNLLLHLAAVAGFFLLLRHFRIGSVMAFWISLFFAVGPQRIESVVWITERKDVLYVGCVLWAIWFFCRGWDRQRFSFMATALMLVAIAAKLPGIMAVPAFLAYALYREKSWKPRHYRGWLWLYPLLGGGMFFWIWSQCSPAVGDPWSRQVPVILHNLAWYPVTTLLPWDVNPFHPNVYVTAGTVILIGLTCAGALLLLLLSLPQVRRRDWDFIGFRLLPLLAVYVAVLLPVIKLTRFNEADYCDRYNYLPAAVLWLMLGLWYQTWRQSRPNAPASRDNQERQVFYYGLAGGYALLLLAFTWLHLPDWSDAAALFRAGLRVPLPTHRAMLGLAAVGMNRDNPEIMLEAGERLRRYARNHAAYPLPEYLKFAVEADNTGIALCGMARVKQGDRRGGMPLLLRIDRQLRSGDFRIYCLRNLFGNLYLTISDGYLAVNKPAVAARALADAIAQTPVDTAGYHFLLGVKAFRCGDLPAATQSFRLAAAMAPYDVRPNRYLARIATGKPGPVTPRINRSGADKAAANRE